MPGRVTRGVAVVVALVVLVGSAALVAGHGNHVSVGPQVATDELVVESVFVSQDAHVVVHRDDGGEPGAVLGVASVTDGFHANLGVPLDSLPDDETTVWVVLHEDNGDGEFDPDDDPPMGSFGSDAASQVAVRAGDRPVFVSAPSESSESVADGTVTVATVAASEDGHVVLRAVEGGDPGAVVGTAPVEAGVSENVTVPIDEEFVTDQRQYFGVYVQLTGDDGDGEFDGEPPLEVAGEPVDTRIGLRKGSSAPAVQTPTDTATATKTETPAAGPGDQLALPGFGVVLVVGALVVILAVGRRRRG